MGLGEFFRPNFLSRNYDSRRESQNKYYNKRKEDLFEEIEARRGLILKGLDALQIIMYHKMEENIENDHN